jgi:hypothetical protein
MKKENTASKYSPGERLALVVFGISSSIFILNVLIGKASILWGWKIFHFGNVGEFLSLLLASISLIAAALHREAANEKQLRGNEAQTIRNNDRE